MPLYLKMAALFLLPFGATYFILPKIISLAGEKGLLDYPGRRKVHQSPRPRIGGIGIMLGILVAIPLMGLWVHFYLAGASILFLIGVLDDLLELRPRLKFMAQIAAVFIACPSSGTMIKNFGDLFSAGPVQTGILAMPLTIFCAIGVINAINMSDGLDGLAGGISLTAFSVFMLLAFLNGQPELAFLSLAMCGAILAFLKFNWPPSRLFMGDAGSMLLGFSLAFISIALTQKEGGIISPVIPLIVLALPITDTITVMVKRLLKGKSPFAADRTHLHHVLVRIGNTRKAALKIILSVSGCFSALALVGVFLETTDAKLFATFGVFFLAYFTGSFFIRRSFRRILENRRESVLAREDYRKKAA
jgi:UDP-GlcNAc:undecaprenyl-phosphate GlcNAc-1-phosphate transferase